MILTGCRACKQTVSGPRLFGAGKLLGEVPKEDTREHKGTLCSIMHVESFESLPIDGHTDLLIDSSSRVKYRGRVAILTTRSLLPIVHRG